MKVSICLPTYNGYPYIAPAIESILGQSFADFELVISDDDSTDETWQVISTTNDKRVSISRNPSRLGLVGNWNQCVDRASGEYVYIFHQDDLMEVDDVQRKVELLNQHPNVGIVFSNISTIDAQGKTIGGHWNPTLPAGDTIFAGRDFFRLLVAEGNLVPCQTVMMRAERIQRFGKFDPRLHYTPDLEMWLRLALHYDVAYIAEPLVKLRRHPNQESARYLAQAGEVLEVWHCFQIIFTEQRRDIPELESMFDSGMGHLQNWAVMLFRRALGKGDLRSAFSFLVLLLHFSYIRQRGARSLAPLAARF